VADQNSNEKIYQCSTGYGYGQEAPHSPQLRKIIVLLLLLVIGFGVFLFYSAAIAGNKLIAKVQKWEYMIASPNDLVFETELSKFGKEGWELVSARRATSGSGYSSSASYEMIFKRPIYNEAE
jgi:hypothetical protein